MALQITLLERLTGKKKKERRAKPTRPQRSEAAKYNRQLQSLVNLLIEETNSSLTKQIVRLEPDYVQDAYASILNREMASLSSRFRDITRIARTVATGMVIGVSSKNQTLFVNALKKSIGVDVSSILEQGGLADIIESKIGENVALIQSIPDEYFKKLITIVNENTTRGSNAGGILKEIQELGKVTKKRARVIARDQTQKVNAAIAQQRQTSLGIEKYEWQTADDDRVRPTHNANDGKVFRWDTPPKITGHPGEDISCRCVAIPIIEVE